ncbi:MULTISPECIES: SymE family type I addiction module toxin [unclassified Xanthomonas]|uniref:SymE family type I addiction module toxin n=1 Tax=unclassified Xanthomonas TaxID=2643310 RepID=UPI00163B166B|nr:MULTISPECIES: SymE family type I addiction module toxin [unclassified Xanthomonas]QNH14536.1 type I addiction module toxin, SymE family [Xanthomonas sp. SI]QNH18771.1 type I addiction module toxin, SymE family [Xanthomonas sp. SS]
MSRKATAPTSNPSSRRRTRDATPSPATPFVPGPMPRVPLGDLTYTTLFNPVLTEDELPRKRAPRPHQPTQCTIGYTCHDVMVDGHRQSQRIPTLRLSGQWLEALGFAPGSKPQIAIVDGALVITPVPNAKRC